MKRVTGIGGIFFKARDAEKLRDWYARHLGLAVESWGGSQFHWRQDADPQRRGDTVWSVFQGDSTDSTPATSRS